MDFDQSAPMREIPSFSDLRAFLSWSDSKAELARITQPVALRHEMTAVELAALRRSGPVLLFQSPVHDNGDRSPIPVVANIFATKRRTAAGLGCTPEELPHFGKLLAELRSPSPVIGMRDALSRWPMLRVALTARTTLVRNPPSQQEVLANLDFLPVQTPWPKDAGPLLTWPVVITRPFGSKANDVQLYNLGVYRAQKIAGDRLILRWLAQRGGAAHARSWARAGQPMPVAIALGCDPAMLLSAALPLPEGVSELTFSGVPRGMKTAVSPARSIPLLVPSQAEMIIEGLVHQGETAPEGPFGDHTGYYNSVEHFPVMQITRITCRKDPLYLSTVTGRPPDEPSVIGEVFNELTLPVIQKQIPEILDLWLPPAACSYRIAIAKIDKRYPGQARRVMMALWGMLPQFSYTKIVIVVDEDIDIRNWDDVVWAISTRMDPSRDLTIIGNTPMDYLDFSSVAEGVAGKLGIDATNKIGAETAREWGKVMRIDPVHAAAAEKLLDGILR